MGLFDRLLIFLRSPWAGRLATVGVPLLFLAFVLFDRLPDTLDAYGTQKPEQDFEFFVNSARIITSDDPSALYARGIDREQWREEKGYWYPSAYPYAPATALLTAPLSQTSVSAGYDAWKIAIGLSSAVVALIVASGFRSWPWRLAVAAAILAWQPLLLNLTLGQTGAFVAALAGIGFFVFVRNQDRGGVVLGVLALKPTAAIPAMLAVFPQRFGVWLRFGVAAAVIALVPFLWLGMQSLWNWVEILQARGSNELEYANPYHHGLTGLTDLSQIEVYAILVVVLVVVLFMAQRVHDRLGLEASAAFAVVTGLLLNPHSMLYDWGVAFVAILLIRQSRSFGILNSDFGSGVLAVSLFFVGQWSSSNVFEDTLLRPVTLWAVAVAGWIGLQSLWPAGPEVMAALSRRLSIGVNARSGG